MCWHGRSGCCRRRRRRTASAADTACGQSAAPAAATPAWPWHADGLRAPAATSGCRASRRLETACRWIFTLQGLQRGAWLLLAGLRAEQVGIDSEGDLAGTTERAPADFELFANALHAATGGDEQGDPALGLERSRHVEGGPAWKADSGTSPSTSMTVRWCAPRPAVGWLRAPAARAAIRRRRRAGSAGDRADGSCVLARTPSGRARAGSPPSAAGAAG